MGEAMRSLKERVRLLAYKDEAGNYIRTAEDVAKHFNIGICAVYHSRKKARIEMGEAVAKGKKNFEECHDRLMASDMFHLSIKEDMEKQEEARKKKE